METTVPKCHMYGERDGGNKSGDGSRDEKGNGRRLGSGGYLLKTQTILTIQIRSDKIRGNIELWKGKCLIGKFVGIWPRERDLV